MTSLTLKCRANMHDIIFVKPHKVLPFIQEMNKARSLLVNARGVSEYQTGNEFY